MSVNLNGSRAVGSVAESTHGEQRKEILFRSCKRRFLGHTLVLKDLLETGRSWQGEALTVTLGVIRLTLPHQTDEG